MLNKLDSSPPEIQDLILLELPLKDALSLRWASPTLLRAYSGDGLASYLKRRLPSDLTLVTMARKLRGKEDASISNNEFIACAKDQELSTEDLVSMCCHLDKLDDLIMDFYKKALCPWRRIRCDMYATLPSWSHPSLRTRPMPMTPMTPLSETEKEISWSVDPLSSTELSRARDAFLTISITCSLNRRMRSHCATPDERYSLLLRARNARTGFLPLLTLDQQQSVCSVHDYMVTTWNAIIWTTRRGNRHRGCGLCPSPQTVRPGPFRDYPCSWCFSLEPYFNERDILCGLGPEGLWRALQIPVRLKMNSPEQKVIGRSIRCLMACPSPKYGSFWKTQNIYLSLQTLFCGSFAFALGVDSILELRSYRFLTLNEAHASRCTTKEEADVGNLAWKIVAKERQKPMGPGFSHDDGLGQRSKFFEIWGRSIWGWGDGWSQVEFGALGMRGWTLWDDERIVKMGWDKVDVLGWIARAETPWSTERERLEVMKKGECFIKRVKYTAPPFEPEPGPEPEPEPEKKKGKAQRCKA